MASSRKSGAAALELLLVTPVSAGRIILGRVWGLWKQFLPAGLVLLVFHGPGLWITGEDLANDWSMEIMLAAGFLTLPVFATYFALRVKNLPGAAFWTGLALFLPVVLAAEITQLFIESTWVEEVVTPLTILLADGALALLACRMLRHSLSRRIYSF